MITTIGIDIGTSAVKSVLFRTVDGKPEWLGKRVDRLRKRDPMKLATEAYQYLQTDAGLQQNDIDYVATTGDGENVEFRTGHFYSMTTHARGAVFLEPDARAVIDIGALHGRAISTDERGKVLSYKMTSQCASGSGQFLENIARYLGVSQDEVGSLSKAADDPETVSSICAVLAETDVINMVSRGISTQNILKGIHLSMAGRLVKLLKSIKAKESTVFVSGGLAQDEGLLAAIREQAVEQKLSVKVSSNSDSIYAGAIGAAIWGAFRYEKLGNLKQLAKAA
ncbi:MAG: benzoyl-CoA reductase subunit D [Deltaproteobacteria bacterium]|jgi:benzoyl-CoA reductase subunit D|uniref:ATPase BadF/BadG/BcrA/BcrD type domain-containing protein n=1 Tax=marine metagenome TaxID=408172 RepID=A0A381TML9_9ZZZZ|nr:benzoyl-CoA reductase subunit D [Deltaproteobacteria bacterium]MDP6308030.1 benzoyl-CoA reductase subunit D [SAR324 cluster bacterium]MAF55009.1 benzoyl-CoA reductase subunit D [Deltaproteobacteria bacterium]MDP6486923.1 benzoyl-CoA reductase subunit D [SAR324 cluster bacterium]MDP7170819.1 benzoyl-CoA reductase subunit D [SAR324 cluster bacterium]|tara:strand:+ start:1992 stop:2834 length:843 start_codon:yes stop_codon:yes gene_type:complete